MAVSLAIAQPKRWSRRRWWLTIALALALHMGLIWQWSDRGPILPRAVRPYTVVSVITDDRANRRLSEAIAAIDPTLFAVPNAHGFSSEAWLKLSPPPHALSSWAKQDHFLELNVTPVDITKFRPIRPAAAALLSPNPPPRLTELSVPEESLATESSVRLEGEIAARPLRRPLVLPPWPRNDILTNCSVVQVAVTPAGEPFTTRLDISCGWPQADQYALRVAKAARFQPLQTNVSEVVPPHLPLAWGRMVFEWVTTSTNAAATNVPGIMP